MMRRYLVLFAVLALFGACNNGDTVADDPFENDAPEDIYNVEDQPADAAAFFISPNDGDTVSSPVAIEMEAEGVDIVPAGVPAVGEAHFHLMVDVGCLETGDIPPGPSPEAQEEGYNHFGDGSTTGELELEPGTYELCLQLGDGVHTLFGATDTITITVE